MTPAWKAAWFDTGVQAKSAVLWRGVEAQHVVATLRLADSLEEQRVLEELLEESKPPLPRAARGRHFLLATPFRYRSPFPSRFRRPVDPGVWYGAEALATACAEVAYWKWRFLIDSAGLEREALHTEHTFFQARARGRAIDLTASPWSAAARAWKQKSDYTACQALADEARQRNVAWIRYASVRAPSGHCAAVLDPVALSLGRGLDQQTWVCKTTRAGAYLQRHTARDQQYEFSAAAWV